MTATPARKLNAGFEIDAPHTEGQERILSDDALFLLADIERRFAERRRQLLQDRKKLQEKLDAGWTPGFLPETAKLREAAWKVRELPADLRDRRVEITGPVDRKMVINALNSGATCFMADFEDSNTPTWDNQISGQINLLDANLGVIEYTDPQSGKEYRLREHTAVLHVRPRGLHMEEKHLSIDGKYASGSFFDFVLYLFHNAKPLHDKGSGPYFYLPKLESYHEAQLWADVIAHAEKALGLAPGTVRVTVLIETITAAFQMDEILHALKDNIAGLNCGRWDYIFSFIKRFAKHREYILPDRGAVTMAAHFLRSYSQLLIRTCHHRGAHAMGGMAAQIPIRNNEAANAAAMEKVRADKEREAGDGHDGTWVAHPALVPLAKEIFDKAMPGQNQLARLREDVQISAADLLQVPQGEITEAGLRRNVEVGLLYLKAWLAGLGCVPIHHLMEDAATAEISRTQLWQWRRHGAKLADGRVIDDALMREFLDDEAQKLKELAGDRYLDDAIALFNGLVMSEDLEDFLTTRAYDKVLEYEKE